MERYRFGDFELDLDAFELRRGGEPVKLERRPLDLLAMFVRQPNRLVARESIVAALWPANVIIDFDSGLNTLVRKVRNALGDSPDAPTFIETVPGRGYRFVALVTAVAEPPERTFEQPPESSSSVASAAAPSASRSRPALIAVWLSVFAAASVAFLVWRNVDTQPEVARIAVMPFENLTGDGALEYLAAGLAEDTSTSLAQIDPEHLRVIGVSAPGLGNAALSIADIGRNFGVDFVVLSSLRLDRTRARVTSRLMRVRDGEQIWSAALDRELTNTLGLQRELSVAIAEQIRLRLSPEVSAAIDRRQTQSPAAYSLYLKGRYEWSQLTPASTRRALEYFEQATTEDPDYALAWAGLAFTAISSMRTADTPPTVMKPVALEALRRAQQLGPDLAETQYAIGYYSMFGDLDAGAAEQAARVAIELDPNNAQAHMLLAMALLGQDQYVEAREMMRRTRELDPMFALAFANSANVALAAGDPEGGHELAVQTVAVNPEFWLGHYYLGVARNALGDREGALDAYAEAARLSGGHSLTYAARAALLARQGRLDEVQALLAEMTARAENQYLPAYTFGVVHALLGNVDAALEALNRAVENGDLGLPGLASDSRLRVLHGDPRFDALLRRCDCARERAAPR
jgi:DNA-binding winged helix-turn-helix (wHTH) protein/TolB-like protein/cytochrome c-type biogenesis protein CcmH/NrfG